MDMKRLNPYQHFGLRQAWMEHFMSEGVQCFEKGVLGNLQYQSLKAWLKDGGLIESNKKERSIFITPLGEKLMKMGPYNPLMWAIVWANLTYNSTICRWYCINAEVGASYEKGDLVVMLGDNLSMSSRDNAVTALTELLRYTPIGSGIKQGLPIEMGKNTYSYLRSGWDYPQAVALLYSLYLYADRTGHNRFTFSELTNQNANSNEVAVSPHEIYGIDRNAFKEQIQGLAIEYPEYIRVSFVSNLDNIILSEYSPADILELAEE